MPTMSPLVTVEVANQIVRVSEQLTIYQQNRVQNTHGPELAAIYAKHIKVLEGVLARLQRSWGQGRLNHNGV